MTKNIPLEILLFLLGTIGYGLRAKFGKWLVDGGLTILDKIFKNTEKHVIDWLWRHGYIKSHCKHGCKPGSCFDS